YYSTNPPPLHDALPIYLQTDRRKRGARDALDGVCRRNASLQCRFDDRPVFAPALAGSLAVQPAASAGRRFERERHRQIRRLGIRSEEHTSELQSPDHLV